MATINIGVVRSQLEQDTKLLHVRATYERLLELFTTSHDIYGKQVSLFLDSCKQSRCKKTDMRKELFRPFS